MCRTVIVNRGEKEIESVRDFKEHFEGVDHADLQSHDIVLDSCLCQIDIADVFKQNNISYKQVGFGDYYVGELDGITDVIDSFISAEV